MSRLPYQPPRRFADLARMKAKKAEWNMGLQKIGELTHSSKRQVLRDYLPYFRIINKKKRGFIASLGLEKEEIKAIN